MRDDILSLIIAPVPTEYTGQLPTDGLELLDDSNGFGVIEVDGLGREDINVNSVQLAGLDVSAYQSTRMQSRPIDISFDYLTNGARKTLRNALPWGEPRRLYITMDDGEGVHSTYWIDVYAENIPLKVTTGTTGSTLTLIALDPFFRSLERRSQTLSVNTSGNPNAFVQNAGDAPAYPIWDFYKTGNEYWVTSYTGTDGAEKTFDIKLDARCVCEDPAIGVSADNTFRSGVRKFAMHGIVAGVYVDFMPGHRECKAYKIDPASEKDAYLQPGGIVTNPRPVWTDENYIVSEGIDAEVDPKAIEAYEHEIAIWDDIKSVESAFAPVAPLSEWISIPSGGCYVRVFAMVESKPDNWGVLTWYDTYTAI